MATSAQSAGTTTLPPPSTASHHWARIGSLVSILPLGVWVVNHLWDNLFAFQGAQAWEQQVTQPTSPITYALTLLIVLLPLVLHTVWGIQRMRTFRPNNLRYPYYSNLKYLLQRVAGAGVLLFVGAHLWLAWLRPRILLGHPERFADIAHEMRFHGPTLAVYLLGTLGVAYHLANGISGFAWSWGLVSGRGGLKVYDRATLVVFLILTAMSWGAIYALWAAGGAAAS